MLLQQKRREVVYKLTVRLPEEDVRKDARVKVDLLTAIFLTAVEDVKKWRVITADYESGCMEAYVLTERFLNITSGRVIVELERTDKEDIT